MAKEQFDDRVERRTLSVLVENQSGVLSQVVRMFSRKGYNIESLAVGETDDSKVSRITIEVMADERMTEFLCSQLMKLIPVHSAMALPKDGMIRRELILIKAKTDTGEASNRVIQLAEIFRASIIDVSPTTMTIAMYGDDAKAKALEELIKDIGLLELVRTGMIALERGADTIYDNTKFKGEFNYGKNVL